ncbi:MAG TPA: xanthine dehydrogenase family protein subunit M [Bacteroidetes bacterium]|nr:xanthine dehydrogenase family protein subunit M [Bacteroidota bacterium]
MIPSKLTYHRPGNVNEAIEMLQNYGDDCKILAGGHSLIPVLKLRLNDPEHLVDISGLEELKGIKDNEKSITIGAGTTHAEIADSDLLRQHAPMMPAAAATIGDRQVRNFGTIGGSIAHADPAADWPAVLLAADANVVIKNANGTREVDIDQFFQGLFMTALKEGEIIVAIRIPKTAFNRRSTYVKFHQPASRFAIVGCAAAVATDGDTVTGARVAFNGVSSKPFRDTGIEKALKGNALNADTIAAATANAADGVSIMSDHFASEAYRKHLAGVYARRALSSL